MNQPAFHREFRVARSKLQHGALLAGVLAVIGLAIIVMAGPSVPYGRLVGAVNLVAALGIWITVRRNARDPRPLMVLDQDGFWFRDWGLETVSWAQLGNAYVGGSRFQAFLCLELRDPEALLARLPEQRRRKISANRLVRPPRLMIPNGALEAPLEDILAALRAGLEQYRS